MQGMWVQSLGQKDSLEREMEIHSSIPLWKIPWLEEPGVLQSMGSQERQTWLVTKQEWKPISDIEYLDLDQAERDFYSTSQDRAHSKQEVVTEETS